MLAGSTELVLIRCVMKKRKASTLEGEAQKHRRWGWSLPQMDLDMKWKEPKCQGREMPSMSDYKLPRDAFTQAVIKVGADFAGFNGAGLALLILGVPVQFAFLRDWDAGCMKMLQQHYSAGLFGGDVAETHAKDLPYVDIYITTPPLPIFFYGWQQARHQRQARLFADFLPAVFEASSTQNVCFGKCRACVDPACGSVQEVGL